MDSDGTVSAAALTRPTRVWCRGGYHVVGLVDGEIHALSHSAAEIEHELAAADGAQLYGCFAMLAGGYQQRLRERLRSAIGGGDLDEILDLVRYGLDPNTRVRSHRSALSVAIRHRSPSAVRELLAAGADPKLLGKYRGSPLTLAVAVGDPEIVRLLLDAGADPTTPDWHGRTCLDVAVDSHDESVARAALVPGTRIDTSEMLSRAVTAGNTPLIIVTLTAGVDPNVHGAEGNTPLHLAARVNDIEAVRLLLAAGADRRARNNAGQTPAALASAHRNHDILLMLIMGDAEGGHDAPPRDQATVRHTAGPIRFPLSARASPDPRGRSGWTLLHLAADRGHIERIASLLAEGANPNTPTPTGFTALHLAVAGRHAVIARRLLDAGADIDAETADGTTPLGLAVTLAHFGMVRLLLAAGADISPCGAEGSLLHEAVRGGNRTIIELLLDHGIDLSARDSAGRTAVEVAAEQHATDVVRILEAAIPRTVARVFRLPPRTAR